MPKSVFLSIFLLIFNTIYVIITHIILIPHFLRMDLLRMNIAILGFGVVGRGVADLLAENKLESTRLAGEEINLKYILDLRDFPGTPYEALVTHNFADILEDSSVECIIETMGGSHPAYEYTAEALRRGKHVITSNKEVVANYGDEFLRIAKDTGASYRFEAAVGGGIPVIAPLIGFLKQNKLTEVRGILNGTTNYILTKMFTYSDSFEDSLKDAQARGYAERNPDADVLGTDAARKIAILAALATGRIAPVDNIHTEGILNIRREDVMLSKSLGYSIKLLGRCVISEDEVQILVAPHLIANDFILSGVSGVYNAIEVIGEPLGNVVFYGKGAGAGATASAVVGDIMQTARCGSFAAMPEFLRDEDLGTHFSDFESESYIALGNTTKAAVKDVFGQVKILSEGEEVIFLTEKAEREADLEKKLEELTASGALLLSRIRVLK